MIRIVLPAYNEEAVLDKLLWRVDSALRRSTLRYEIVVIDDGSTDRTAEIAKYAGESLPIRLICHIRNQGLGAAIKTGLTAAAKVSSPQDIIVTMDADNTHPPDLISSMVAMIEHHSVDIVIASRFVAGAQEVGLSAYRKLLSRGASILMRFLFPIVNVKDYTCGYRAYRAETIQKAIGSYGESFISEKGFNAIVEILLKLRSQSINICELPLLLRYDQKQGASKMPIMKTVYRYGALIMHQLFRPKADLVR